MRLLSHLPSILKDKGHEFIPVAGNVGQIRFECQALRVRYRIVKCLEKNLRGREDIHGKPYQPHTYIYVQRYGTGTMLIKAKNENPQLALSL